ncbi:MAG: S10 family peptidase [bacterium]
MSEKDDHVLPEGATSSHSLTTADGTRLDYVARADWMAIRRREKTIAEMFHVAYVVADEAPASATAGQAGPAEAHRSARRPITFIFNGGPGAASAFLHMGAIGPRRVVFNDDGTPLPPPVELTDNRESWLAFTDLVFIDPIGTGFSRATDRDSRGKNAGKTDEADDGSAPAHTRVTGSSRAPAARHATVLGPAAGAGAGGGSDSTSSEGSTGSSNEKKPELEFFGFKRDLESLCEFIRSFLSQHARWESPVFIAGESYGGYRVGKLTRMLQEKYGVGLNGALLISPALEFMSLDNSDYDVLPWVDTFPTYSLAAAAHGRAAGVSAPVGPLDDSRVAEVRQAAEKFATRELPPLLMLGESLSERERSRILTRISRFTGLSRRFVERKAGRIGIRSFARELLRDRRRVLGLYDASVSITDPYPDRDTYEGPDATLAALDRVFSAGINTQLRSVIGVNTTREYHLLSLDANEAWKVDFDRHALESHIGATDDLRYGIQLNPHMHVRISHGLFDMVTPYYASQRIAANMKLDDDARSRVTLRHYPGGHMFYAWDTSRRAFSDDVREFYRRAVGR